MVVIYHIRMMSGLLKRLRSKWNPPPETTSTFDGKTIVVTDSNTRLGLGAARSFLAGSHVILAVRNTSKRDVALDQLEAQTGRTGDISVLGLDLNSFASVKSIAEGVSQQFSKIDIVILNAGTHNREYSRVQRVGKKHYRSTPSLQPFLHCYSCLSCGLRD